MFNDLQSIVKFITQTIKTLKPYIHIATSAAVTALITALTFISVSLPISNIASIGLIIVGGMSVILASVALMKLLDFICKEKEPPNSPQSHQNVVQNTREQFTLEMKRKPEEQKKAAESNAEKKPRTISIDNFVECAMPKELEKQTPWIDLSNPEGFRYFWACKKNNYKCEQYETIEGDNHINASLQKICNA